MARPLTDRRFENADSDRMGLEYHEWIRHNACEYATALLGLGGMQLRETLRLKVHRTTNFILAIVYEG